MKKGEKRLFLGVLAILLAALVLLLIQWVRGANNPKVYHVSVLLDGAESDYWKNFRAGINQAALEQNVDVRFVTRFDGAATQVDALRTEWEGEADGVVLIPTDATALSAALKDAPAGLVVGVVGPPLDSDRVNCYIAPDYTEVGRALAEAAMEAGGAEGCTLYVSETPSPAAIQTQQALVLALEERGVAFRRETLGAGSVPTLPQAGALLAAEPTVTETLCTAPGGYGRVVGVGASGRLLHYLEEGTAAALVVQSDYNAGYLALSQVVRRLSKGGTENAVLKTYTASGDNLFEEPMIDILFATY